MYLYIYAGGLPFNYSFLRAWLEPPTIFNASGPTQNSFAHGVLTTLSIQLLGRVHVIMAYPPPQQSYPPPVYPALPPEASVSSACIFIFIHVTCVLYYKKKLFPRIVGLRSVLQLI